MLITLLISRKPYTLSPKPYLCYSWPSVRYPNCKWDCKLRWKRLGFRVLGFGDVVTKSQRSSSRLRLQLSASASGLAVSDVCWSLDLKDRRS